MDQRCGFGKRLAAALLDGVLMLVLGSVVGMLFGGLLGGLLPMGGQTDPRTAAALGSFAGAFAGAMAGIYFAGIIFAVLESFLGWTPGKLLLGIRIRSATGAKAPISSLLIRAAFKYASTYLGLIALLTGIAALSTVGSLVGVLYFFGCFMVFTEKRQGLHDVIAKTAVYPKEVGAQFGSRQAA